MARKYWYPSDFDAGLCTREQLGKERFTSEPAPETPEQQPADEPPVVNDQMPVDEEVTQPVEEAAPQPVAEPKRKGK